METLVVKPVKPSKNLNHVTLENDMNFICPRCQGIIVGGVYPAGQASMTVEGQRFHFYCGWKEQERLKEKAIKEAKSISQARKPYDFDDFGSAR